ncbi:hypothetical protein A1Q1_03285 [Trichosporon asahii var. asahii CBS 2479]|uniref:BTB domain-containing protein n=1 Tax=Trichosporon asahii var. asahii (strain ATCC 90039 / CBS 2479 / JCM 2466 / KCTC 7840 / NBRC 103889/ NCYC 2677 / UAMH 7654) TaxID=1186058 RepID=J6ETC5_TRIAS|nr:hypothetical protein A1Q1_03285 [Trichosporon asahii var. asahii CBS 2479]EJT47824.1 hypothetical protein A1Q1_03285 [Trichosporon asahii var. asahii CBS 2479]
MSTKADDTPTQDETWKDGDFEVISSDNVKFCIPTHLLQTASGEKRIELDASAATITALLRITSKGFLSFDEPPSTRKYREIVDLVNFVRKYDCEAAGNFLLFAARTAPDHTRDQAVIRLLILVFMDDKYLCAELFDKYSQRFEWLQGDASSVFRGSPYGLFAVIPFRYFWAMVAANVTDPDDLPIEYMGKRKAGLSSPGSRFLHYMAIAEKRDDLAAGAI